MQAAAATQDPLFGLQDDNDAFLNDENPHKTAAREAAKVTLYKRTCPKCGGTGSFGRVSALGHSKCTKCEGRGFFETKVSPELFEKRKDRREARKERAAAADRAARIAAVEAWKLEHPAETSWLKEKAPHFEFAAKMIEAIKQWGSLTERQMAAIHRCMLQDQERAAAREAQGQRAEAVDITPVIKAFDKAGAALRTPVLRTEHFRFSKAPATGKNPGAIYVKTLGTEEQEGQYLGKIFGGLFQPGRDCSPEQQKNLMEVCQDPLGAVVRYGRLTGRCGICARKLENKESVERGIGPICAEKFGF